MKIKFSRINRAAALCAVAFITLTAPYANAGRATQFGVDPGPTTGSEEKVSQNRIKPKPLPPKVAAAVRDPSVTGTMKTGTFTGTLKGF